jgi:hypothetical protein
MCRLPGFPVLPKYPIFELDNCSIVDINAVVAQLVERLLAKEKVAGSNPVRRSIDI